MYKTVDISSWLVDQNLVRISEEIFKEENIFTYPDVKNKQLKEGNQQLKKQENGKL